MIKWLKGSTKSDPKDLMNLPEINLSQWISDGQQAELAKLLANPIVRMALRIVSESIPVPMPGHHAKESDIVFAAGVTAGYAHCLENLRKLAANQVVSEPEATFEKQY